MEGTPSISNSILSLPLLLFVLIKLSIIYPCVVFVYVKIIYDDIVYVYNLSALNDSNVRCGEYDCSIELMNEYE